MSITAADITKEILDLWNRPSLTDLPERLILSAISRRVNRVLLLFQISDRNYLANISDAFTITDRDQLLGIDDASSIVRVDSRPVGSDDDAWSEELVEDYGPEIEGVAIYGSPMRIAVGRDVSSTEFRIVYETGGVALTTLSDVLPVAIQEFFKGLLVYGAAAECGVAMDNLNGMTENSRDKKVAWLTAKEQEAYNDLTRWVLNNPGQSVTYREAFNSSRLGSGMPVMVPNRGYISPY